jgi:hypothetical protein
MGFFKDFTAHHRLGLIVFAGVLALLFYHEWHNKGADISNMETVLKQNKADFDAQAKGQKESNDLLKKQLDEIAAQKQQVITTPSAAPIIIRENIPMQTPIIQTAPITKDTKPGDQVASLSLQQEQDLAKFSLDCKACRDNLAKAQGDNASKDKQILDLQGSLAKAEDTARGGSPFKKTLKIIGIVGCGAGGAWLGSKADRTGKGAAIGAGLGVTGCALKFHF